MSTSWSTANQSERQMQKAFLQYFPHWYASYWAEFDLALKSWIGNKRFQPQFMVELDNIVKTPFDRHYKATGAVEI